MFQELLKIQLFGLTFLHSQSMHSILLLHFWQFSNMHLIWEQSSDGHFYQVALLVEYLVGQTHFQNDALCPALTRGYFSGLHLYHQLVLTASPN